MNAPTTITSPAMLSLDAEDRLRQDQWVMQALLAQLPIVALLAPWGYGTYMFTVPACVLIAGAAALGYQQLKGKFHFGTLMGVLLALTTAVLIQSQMGSFVMHLHGFVILALLAAYGDWRPIAAAAGVLGVHHLLFTLLQLLEVRIAGVPILLYSYGVSWGTTVILLLFLALEAACLIYFGERQKKEEQFSQRIMRAIHNLAQKRDLTERISGARQHPVAEAFNNVVSDLELLVGDTRKTVSELSRLTQRAGEESEGSSSTTRQREQISNTVDAMGEMSTAIKAVAKNAQDAASVALHADEEAQGGASMVAQAIDTTQTLMASMNEANSAIEPLNESAQNIGSVIDVIRDISEQTNLLALNAAIEAARAGEQGRGFAVVSDEVRILAQRTQKSTEEIQQIIEALQSVTGEVIDHINRGRDNSAKTSEDIARAGSSIQSITDAVSRINDMHALNASSAEQQSISAKVISDNIQTISDLGDSTAAVLEQSEQTVDEIHSLSQELQEKLKRYRTRAHS